MSNDLEPVELEFLINNPGIFNQLSRTQQQFTNTTQQIQQQLNQSSSAFESWAKKAAVAAASYFSISAVKGFASSLIEVRGQFEQLNVAYETILRSKKKGDALFQESIQLAATTPFQLTEVAQSTKQLLAYGTDVKEVTNTVRMLGDVASGVSAPLGDIVYLYGTLKTQGRAYAQDIRQFTGRGIPIIQELAKQFGVTEAQVSKLVEQGKVGFPQVQKAFESLTGSGGIFYNLMEKQSHTLTGQLSNLKDAWAVMLNKIGESSEGFLSGGIQAASELLKNYEKVLDILELLIVAYGSYRAVLLLSVAASSASTVAISLEAATYYLLRNGIMGAIAAMDTYRAGALLTAAQTAAFTAGLTALALVVYSFATATDRASAAIKNLNDITAEAQRNILAQKDKINNLEAAVVDLNKTEAIRIKAAVQLRSIMGDRLKQYSDEQILAGKAKVAIDEYTKSLLKNATAAAAQSKLQDIQSKLIDLDTKGIDGIPFSDRLSGSLKRFFSGDITTNGKDEAAAAVAAYRKILQGEIADINKAYGQEIQKLDIGETDGKKSAGQLQAEKFAADLIHPIKNFPALIKEAIGKSDFDSIKKALEDKKTELTATLAPDEKQISGINKRIEQVNKILAKYDLKTQEKLIAELENEQQRRNKIFDDVARLNEQARENAQTQDEKEVAQVKAKYDAILKEIDRFNKDKRNKTKIDPTAVSINGVITNVPKAEQNAVDDVIAKQQVEKQKVLIEQQKNIFDAFESYKIKAGEDAATKLYGAELKGFKTYVEYLESLRPKSDDLSAAANDTRDMLSKLIPEAKKDEKQKQMAQFADLLLATQTYEQQRKVIIEKAEKDIAQLLATGHADQAAQARKNMEVELTQLDDANAEQLEAYKELYDGLHKISVKKAKEDIAILEDYAERRHNAGLMTDEAYLKLINHLHETKTAIDEINPQKLEDIGGILSNLSSSFTGINAGLGDLVAGLGKTASSLANVTRLLKTLSSDTATASEKSSAQIGLIGAGIGAVTDMVGVFTSAAKQRKEAEKAYYDAVLASQYEYNLSLIEEQRIREQLDENVFLGKDYRKDILNASLALSKANNDFNTSLGKLQAEGQAKDGTHNAVSGSSVGKGAAAGATIGGIVGSVVPVIGTAIGAAAGAVIGAIAGLFGGKKKVDTLVPIFQKYPDLIKKNKDGVDELNESLAKNLIQNNLVSDSTKTLLQNTIDLNEARKASIEQINADIKDLAGNLGDDLRTALVKAFEDGTDAAIAFGDSVSKVIENIVSQFLFQDIFSGEFDKLQQNLKDSFGITGDQNATDDLTQFFKDAGPLTQQYLDALKQAQEAAKANGLNIFQSTNPTAGNPDTSTAGKVSAALTEDTASEVLGTLHGIQLYTAQLVGGTGKLTASMADQLAEVRQQTLLQKQIEVNTRQTAQNTAVLPGMSDSLKNIDKNTKDTTGAVLRAAGITK